MFGISCGRCLAFHAKVVFQWLFRVLFSPNHDYSALSSSTQRRSLKICIWIQFCKSQCMVDDGFCLKVLNSMERGAVFRRNMITFSWTDRNTLIFSAWIWCRGTESGKKEVLYCLVSAFLSSHPAFRLLVVQLFSSDLEGNGQKVSFSRRWSWQRRNFLA